MKIFFKNKPTLKLAGCVLLLLLCSSKIYAQVNVSARVLLQGAVSGTTMTTTLNTLGFIPMAQPYNKAPYNYSGTESVTSIPADVTDWLLVELRDANNLSTVTATRAAFVKSDGSVVDLDGTSVVSFPTVTAGNYYIAIHHRNHLTVVSAAPVSLPNTIATQYDFTTGLDKAMDNGSNNSMVMVQLAGGRWAMWAGDYNHDESIDSQDYIYVNSEVNHGLSDGYFMGDLNFDGFVDSQDQGIVLPIANKSPFSPLF